MTLFKEGETSEDPIPFDASGYMGVSYMYRGPTHTINPATYDVSGRTFGMS